ncbi:hypothetical protein C8J57DRAFT_1227627 [Mycena rebaudengoi]|nr:hypothetical protein C8J57DRAFT_1227627 [Mycena rebaudengoi]
MYLAWLQAKKPGSQSHGFVSQAKPTREGFGFGLRLVKPKARAQSRGLNRIKLTSAVAAADSDEYGSVQKQKRPSPAVQAATAATTRRLSELTREDYITECLPQRAGTPDGRGPADSRKLPETNLGTHVMVQVCGPRRSRPKVADLVPNTRAETAASAGRLEVFSEHGRHLGVGTHGDAIVYPHLSHSVPNYVLPQVHSPVQRAFETKGLDVESMEYGPCHATLHFGI